MRTSSRRRGSIGRVYSSTVPGTTGPRVPGTCFRTVEFLYVCQPAFKHQPKKKPAKFHPIATTMSSVYATEPASSGRVLFETTHGPLEIQLWCRECPTVTKLFLQLCMDGFYDNMIFHRIVSDFLIQTGASRQGNKPAAFTKDYQNKIQAPQTLERRKYETHSRLRFNHRGQLAMALGVNDDDDEQLQPQFFITLDEAPYLDGKHVLFGTCSGPTIFNALRIGKMAVDDNHQPIDLEHAPRITACKIIENPMHISLVSSAAVPWRVEEDNKVQKKKKKRKGKKDLNVLSFGDEMEAEEDLSGIKSSHDVVSSKILSKSVDEKVKEAVANAGTPYRAPREEEKRKESEVAVEPTPDELKKAENKPVSPPPSVPIVDTKLEENPPQKQDATNKQPKVSLVEARLARFKGNTSKNKRNREEDTMAKLVAFQSKVKKQTANRKSQGQASAEQDNSLAARMARKAEATKSNEPEDNGETYNGQVLEDDENDEKSDWMGTRFKCRRHIDHSSRLGDDEKGGDGRDMNDYEVIDEKGKRSDRGEKRHQHKHHRPDGRRPQRK